MMVTAPNTPIYEDRLVAWHNQRLWWLLCGCGAVNAMLAIVLCVVTLRPHNVPYVLEVDGKGEPVGTVQPFIGQQAVSDNILRWVLAEYIRQAFSVSRSFDENQMNLSRAYGMSTGQASQALTSYYRAEHDAHNPLMVTKYWQDVRILRTLKLSAPFTYQVDYLVEKHDNDHLTDPTQTNWRATLRVIQGTPSAKNPLGIWVADQDFEPEQMEAAK